MGQTLALETPRTRRRTGRSAPRPLRQRRISQGETTTGDAAAIEATAVIVIVTVTVTETGTAIGTEIVIATETDTGTEIVTETDGVIVTTGTVIAIAIVITVIVTGTGIATGDAAAGADHQEDRRAMRCPPQFPFPILVNEDKPPGLSRDGKTLGPY